VKSLGGYFGKVKLTVENVSPGPKGNLIVRFAETRQESIEVYVPLDGEADCTLKVHASNNPQLVGNYTVTIFGEDASQGLSAKLIIRIEVK